MLNLLRSIVESIVIIFNFFQHVLLSLIQFIGMIPTYVTFLFSLVDVVPSFALVFFGAGIYLTVVMLLINREA